MDPAISNKQTPFFKSGEEKNNLAIKIYDIKFNKIRIMSCLNADRVPPLVVPQNIGAPREYKDPLLPRPQFSDSEDEDDIESSHDIAMRLLYSFGTVFEHMEQLPLTNVEREIANHIITMAAVIDPASDGDEVYRIPMRPSLFEDWYIENMYDGESDVQNRCLLLYMMVIMRYEQNGRRWHQIEYHGGPYSFRTRYARLNDSSLTEEERETLLLDMQRDYESFSAEDKFLAHNAAMSSIVYSQFERPELDKEVFLSCTENFFSDFMSANDERAPPSIWAKIKGIALSLFDSPVRDIGIRAWDSFKETIDSLLSIIGNAFSGALAWVTKQISKIFRMLITTCIPDITMSVKAKLCAIAACAIAAYGMLIPAPLITPFTRGVYVALAGIAVLYQSFLPIGVAALIMKFLSSSYDKHIIAVYNTVEFSPPVVTPQSGFETDNLKNLIVSTLTVGAMFVGGTVGLDLPTLNDPKKWTEVMKRHDMLKKAVQSWEFGIDKLTEWFEHVSIFVCEIFGKDYTSMKHIPEVEKLYHEVLHLTSLDEQIKIGRDPELTIHIEKMYRNYLELRTRYTDNRFILNKLNVLAAPLVSYYNRVSDKNPRSHTMRMEPACIMIRGATGIGKTHMTSILQQDILKGCGKYDPNDEGMAGTMYARCIEQEFWDGYFGQPIVVFDDFAQKKDSVANPNLEFFEIIRGKNVFPYQLHMAHLADKANTSFTSDFVLLTTNLNTQQIPSLVCSEAFERRIDVNVEMSLIPEVADIIQGKQRLNVVKLKLRQQELNLEDWDLSHLLFTDKKSGNIWNYDQLLIEIMNAYKGHYEAFNARKNNNISRRDRKLPPGCFSLDSRWVQPQNYERIFQAGNSYSAWIPRVSFGIPKLTFSNAAEFGHYFVEAAQQCLNKGKQTTYAYIAKAKKVFEDIREYFKSSQNIIKFLKAMGGIVVTLGAIYGIVSYATSNKKVAEAESPMRTQATAKKTVYESPMRTQQTTKSPKFESPMRAATVQTRPKFEHSFEKINLMVNPESGRNLDENRTRKLQYEGIVSQQMEDLVAIAEQNIMILYVRKDGEEFPIGMCTILKGRKALINFHYLQLLGTHYSECEDKDGFELCFKAPNMELGVPCTFASIMSSAIEVKRGGNRTEFYLITLPQRCMPGRDLTRHMITAESCSKLENGLSMRVVSYRRSGDGFRLIHSAGPFSKLETVVMKDLFDGSMHEYPKSMRYNICTQKGDCGSPVFVNSDLFARKIVGFHFAGDVGVGYASVICADDVLPHLHEELCRATPNNIQLCSVDFPIKESSFWPQGKTIGTVSHPVKTSLLPSVIQGVFGEPEMVPAQLAHPLKEDGPMIRALKKNAGEVKHDLDPIILEEVRQDFFESCIAPFQALGYEKRILTFEEACAGIDGNQFISAIKRSKSAGYPYMLNATKGKTDWFGSDGNFDFSSQACKELRRNIHEMEQQCKFGIIPEVCFVATLKDEKRTVAKVQAGKTRVFSACPMDFLILFRRYFGGYIAFMTRNKIKCESAVGTNVHGTDWGKIVEHLCAWSDGGNDNISAGDFENFDGSFHPDLFMEVCTAINSFYGGTPEESMIRKCLWSALAHPIHVMANLIFVFSHGQPSGSPITALSNSNYVSLATRYVLWPILKSLQLKFAKHVRLVAYGDDTLVNFSPILAAKVSPYILAQAFAKIGMTYTTAHKDAVSEETPFENISQVSFLKRDFVYDEQRGHWYAPLELRSIREMCNWVRKSPSVLQATRNNCNDALRELCHHSKDTFNEYQKVLSEAAREQGFHLDIPTWERHRDAMSMDQIDYLCEGRSFV